MAEEKNTTFNYLLNSMEHAGQEAHPAKAGYAGKRKALLAHVRELERDAARYRWLRKYREVSFIVTWFGNGCVNKTVEMAEARLDEEMAAHGVMGIVNPACGVHGPIPCEGAGCTCGVQGTLKEKAE